MFPGILQSVECESLLCTFPGICVAHSTVWAENLKWRGHKVLEGSVTTFRYRELLLKLHPDRTPGDDAADSEGVADVVQAYRVLSDDKLR